MTLELVRYIAWPATVLVLIVVFSIVYRRSFTKLVQGIAALVEGIKLKEAPGLKFELPPQQQIENAKNEATVQANLTPPIVQQNRIVANNDPVLAPRISALREELDKRTADQSLREQLLLESVAVWQVNHENARLARFIFGSQLEILLHLNARPNGEEFDNVRQFYDRATQTFPETFKNYPFENYISFLSNSQLINRDGQRVTITPRGRALLHYLVATGDTQPRPN